MPTTQTKPPSTSGGFFSQIKGLGKSYLGSGIHQKGAEWVKWELGIHQDIKKMPSGWMKRFAKWGGRGFLGYSAIQGYREEGLWGTAKAVPASLATTYALGAAWGGIKGGVMAGAAAVAPIVGGIATLGAIAGAAYYQQTGVAPWHILARPYVRDHMRKHAKLEMGAPVYDQFGTLSTMRQRSVAAIQNSHINARSALGHEAMSMYRPYSAMGLRGGI